MALLLKYEIFNKTVELGSLTKAAKELNLTQSAVSHAISSLESEFGFSLLTRNRYAVCLTSNGERILNHIREILSRNENLKQDVNAINGLEIGTINIGTFTSVSTEWLPGIIKQFKMQYPLITINFFEGNYDEIETWINKGTVDFGFMTRTAVKSFEFIPLKNENIVCVLSKDHPLHHLDTISVEQIKDEPMIFAKWGVEDDVTKLFQNNGIIPNIKYEFSEVPAIFAMIENGLGISLLPEMLAASNSKNVSIVRLSTPVFRTIGIAANELKNLSPASKKFIDCVKTWLSEKNSLDY